MSVLNVGKKIIKKLSSKIKKDMYRIKDIIEHTDKSLSLDFKGRICVKDPMSSGVILLPKCEYADDIVEKLNNILSQYKYSYYIEYTDIFHGFLLPAYTEKNDDIKISIDYVKPAKFGYYILNIVDGNGKNIDNESLFFKEEDYRDDEFNEEFARAKRQCLNYLEDVKYTFNDTMEQFEKSEYKI